MIVNQTSVLSVFTLPFGSAYNASKAAMAMFSDSQRLELAPFGITVIELKTGIVRSNFLKNQMQVAQATLPANSIYALAKDAIEEKLRGDGADALAVSASVWAKQVVQDLLKQRPPSVIWRGGQAGRVRMGTFLPFGMLDKSIKKMTGIDILEQKLRQPK
jgi:NAD(P)-dependent dehydrogenase (short-subunit alcohol dehydrogenase family)